ncbi:monofunctional biosynthetic peptidoglycan transglycosylase [Amphritea pacifica]|uniref:Biosynthetic peptidoglycan transglycosylase n=1 Tax=Amphritea pacifica TaxID=2811233 RepID=A0ABS2WAB3_9GAMM|nr:monofunctional biosynthetic peptidoglycan transglycosylase [Amphritea pacifica]MBN0988658.1 monofunctional biosynthetic peptidoglycan transglycosylase [Amphritea pacifica]MBN1005404.1 monofunctional biosynthetic peptidoglycan transglycosylase [Amphritea pacifica]
MTVSRFSIRKWLIRVLLILILLPVLLVLMLRFIDPAIWMWKIQRDLNPPQGYPAHSQHIWAPLDQISGAMQLAVIASEDQKFPQHWGLDLESIADALSDNEKGGRIRGASTLTQQTAKNLFLWPTKSYLRKGLEAGLAVLMEALWTKQRILEVYLNIVEFGPGIYGVEAASQAYFHKPAQRLSPIEAARLAAVLPNPYRLRAANPSNYVWQRIRWITHQMQLLGPEHWNP